ncbi:uncharacterized protein PV06_05995 [Exophiala oligosperma]|uniref:Uncharacterized protein n=1 Tax=Exophiala oligosperma TaxID=215243 RepID=A0A0D2E3U0_9EURO|nr:uncharacterized protein PV06_05995 [Exophiala oligosperma]KIW42444.1 hypothetical protein PV06_05995 [Exophiala oligosperma]
MHGLGSGGPGACGNFLMGRPLLCTCLELLGFCLCCGLCQSCKRNSELARNELMHRCRVERAFFYWSCTGNVKSLFTQQPRAQFWYGRQASGLFIAITIDEWYSTESVGTVQSQLTTNDQIQFSSTKHQQERHTVWGLFDMCKKMA